MPEVRTVIVGTRFYEGAGAALTHSREEAPVKLIREPENPFDPNAIAVHLPEAEGIKVGHIPRTEAAFLASIMDQGIEVAAQFNPISPALLVTWEEPKEPVA